MELGAAARNLRESFGITQRAAADRLGVSYVHLCNVEKGNSRPSPELVERYREVFGVDLYVYSWCTTGDAKKLPAGMRELTERMAEQWRKLIAERRKAFTKAG